MKHDFIKYNSFENCIELYADHHMLSALRKCEAYFVESILNRSVRGRSWPFDFGIWLHACVEYMYSPSLARIRKWASLFDAKQVTQDATQRYCSVTELVDFGAEYWKKMDFSLHHTNHPQYKAYNGFNGAMKMLLDYHKMYGEERERYTIVGTECSFGYNKEVFLGEFWALEPPKSYLGDMYLGNKIQIKCYYSGRIDIIVDDGLSIGVMDTKTRSKFTGYEATDFTPHDGMQGYVYALRHILAKYFSNEEYLTRPCNRMVINHIQVSDCRNYVDRFKRTPITYTLEQLDEWRLRQLRSFKKLYELTVLNEVPDWNTDVCSHFFYGSPCPYKELHRQTASQRELIRKSQYITLEPWSPVKEDGFMKEVK